jgi:uncharacterized protein YsxB (DUF464 family)
MTSASFKQHGDVFRILIDGHAGFNLVGDDIVCAGASTLTYTLLQCLIREHKAGNMAVFDHDIDEKKGHFYVRMKPMPHAVGYVEVMVSTVASGFGLLAHKYPEHVNFQFKN